MKTVYRILRPDDERITKEFSESVKHGLVLENWIVSGVRKNSAYFVAVGEFRENRMTGLVVACSLGYFLRSQELLPMWLGVRVDRVKSTEPSFRTFLDCTSSLIADRFESLGYFQHVMVRRLPKAFTSNLQLSKVTGYAWAQGDYQATVEYVVKSKEDLDSLPLVYQQMIGSYRFPVVVFSVTMTDENRAKRSRVVRTEITYEKNS